MRRIMISIFLAQPARWVVELQTTPKLVRSMVFVCLAVVLTGCVGEAGTSTIATTLERSITTIEAGSATVATSTARSTMTEDVSPTVAGPYEPVFLRLEVVGDTHDGPVYGDAPSVVLAVGVNLQGEEREIARLPGAWVAYWPRSGVAYLRPLGAVSPTGLLAMPSEDAGSPPLTMQWEIFDLLHAETEAVIIDGVREFVELVGSHYTPDLGSAAFWGPDERLAITWGPAQLGLLSFVEGRTGVVTTVESPGETWERFPAWAADGSGIFTSDGRILRPDGTRTDSSTAIREESCKRQFESEGSDISLPTPVGASSLTCIAPDDSMIVFNQENTYFKSTSGVAARGEDTWVEVDGSFAGWLDVDP